MKTATCTGCEISSDKAGVYGDDNPVEEDGTYANGKFVCDVCYSKLISVGLDLGAPETVQNRARIQNNRGIAK